MKKTGLALLLAICMLGAAAAETISFSGTVEASETAQVYGTAGLTVETVPVRVGQAVTADTVIATLKTTKVYAPEDGTVSAVFAEAGDRADAVTERYGGIVYLESPYTLMVSTTTNKAYEEKENYIVHPGETVYVVSRSHNSTRGKGIITTVEGSSYTVLITEGEFLVGDSVNICRGSNYSLMTSLGRGNISRVSPTAVTGSGYIVSCAVQAGDKVTRGQLLFETVTGDFGSPEEVSTEIRAGTDGVISILNVCAGGSLEKAGVIAEIYPKNAVQVTAEVSETDLKELSVGQKVKVELDWNQDLGVSYEGTVEMISCLGTAGEESTTFPVYVSFLPDDNTRYGMTALVTTLESGEEAEDENAEESGEPETGDEAGQEEDPEADGRPGETENTGERPRGEGRQRTE